MTDEFTPPIETEESPVETTEEPDAPEAPAATKAKTKAQLEIENADLLAQVKALETENATLKSKLPEGITPRDGYKVVFIKSNGVPAIKKDGKKFIQGDVNGVKFEVPCDVQTEVPDHVAEALRGVIESQGLEQGQTLLKAYS